MSAQYVNTLRYWFDVEALMYPDLPRRGKYAEFRGRYADRLPWTPTAADAPPVDDDVKYFVYFGLIAKPVLETELAEMFEVGADRSNLGGNPGGNHQRPAYGNTFLCAIEVTANGYPVISTLQLAAYSVAFAERKNRRTIGYTSILGELKARAQSLASTLPRGYVDADWFDQLTDFLIEALDWKPRELLAREQFCAHKVPLVTPQGKRLARAPDMDPINSFYLDDLERLRVSAEQGLGSRQVQAYLDGHQRSAERQDVTTFEAVNAALAAHRFPVGRWPTPFPLFLMQQAAVNLGLESLADGGMFSVNGPPGTGKTTLLMDVIAARIVDRAQLLSQFDHPTQAFTANGKVAYAANPTGGAWQLDGYLLNEKLLDNGIVVASANNKAVENITLDLPSLEKVSPQPLLLGGQPFDYFAEAAEWIINQPKQKTAQKYAAASDDERPEASDDQDDQEADQDGAAPRAPVRCWGLISVALGNKTNRNRVGYNLGKNGAVSFASQLGKIPASELDWHSARLQFSAAVARVEAMQAAIGQHDATLVELAAARSRLTAAGALDAAAHARQLGAQAALHTLEQATQDNAEAVAANLQERDVLSREWPWWRQLIARLLRPAQHARFGLQQRALAHEYDQLRAARASLQQQRPQALAEASAAMAAWRDAQAVLASRVHAVDVLEAQRRQLCAHLGVAAFDPAAYHALSVDDQQKCLPRSSPSYHAARADVFVAAMHLHKAFMKNAGKPFDDNFRLALAMVQGDPTIKPYLPAMARHLWATFFLAVPVVSSTFASIARCFGDLGEGQIGLLLVDEAGQAVPSHALGAIWRARRALIVGDPLQVEPVLKMDRTLDLAMLRYHGAPQQHLLTANSAQHLADRGNRHGANLVQYDGSDLWVGAPLRVHRRCADPMFSLSNQIAYNGKMVFGPPRAEEAQATLERPLLGPSCWIDFPAGEFDQHYSAAEGQQAVEIVLAYQRQGWLGKDDGLPDLFLISPFKSVAEGLHQALRECSKDWAKSAKEERIAKWLKDRVGTVHTFQGKECETVVLVLGGKTAGARNWAASQPNIINVAVTRAKRRLYVIGDRQGWAQTAFGSRLAQAVAPSAIQVSQ